MHLVPTPWALALLHLSTLQLEGTFDSIAIAFEAMWNVLKARGRQQCTRRVTLPGDAGMALFGGLGPQPPLPPTPSLGAPTVNCQWSTVHTHCRLPIEHCAHQGSLSLQGLA